MNSPSPSGPLILSVPNEILRHVFSRLFDLSRDKPFVKYYLNGRKYEVAQMLVLCSVCRYLRAITAKLDFWCNADFQFTDLIPPSYEVRSFASRYPEVRLLKALFNETHLVNSLGQRKTNWVFQSLEGMVAVLEGVPLFVQNA